LQATAEELKRERDGYIAFANKELRKEKEREAEGLSKEESEKKIEKLKVEETTLIEQLKDLEKEERQLAEELANLEQEESLLDLEEAK
jgi:beclin